jgi:hypothetical protein
VKRIVTTALVVCSIAATPAIAHADSHARAAAERHAVAASKRYSTKTLLNQLTVKARHDSGYKRSKFKLWTERSNGCNTRYVVLIHDAKIRPLVSSGCYLSRGQWVSPYDGVTTTNPTKVQIDHVVPLEDAWAEGAWKWSADTRKRYANDLGTKFDLLAVSAHSNESKGDKGPDQWLPTKKSFDCKNMTDYTAVMWRWRLTIDKPEKTFLNYGLSACGWPSIAEPARPKITHASSSSSGGGGGGGTTTTPPASHSCTTTSSGSCIKAGEFCKQADYGQTGYDADGNRLTCTGSASHPHWED